MEQVGEMMVVPNTPTLVAEENLNHHPKPRVVEPVAGGLILHRRSKEADKARDRLPEAGEYLDNDQGQRFFFRQKLGDGAMGHVFLSFYDGKTVAIKTEKYSTGMLPIEIKVLASMKRNKGTHFCNIHDYGTIRREYNYMVISLLGKDLYRLRVEMPNRCFSMNTTTKIALETLEAIEELHNVGYVSRDVKPSNFAPGVREQGGHKTIFMFDFGLAKKFVDRENRKLKSRGEVGWRGTVRYGSLQAHKRLDLGRRDDIECWFYMLVEMLVGELPWRHVTDRNAVGQAKQSIRKDTKEQFFRKLPRQLETIIRMIDGYTFEIRPEYKHLRALIKEIRVENGLSDRVTWDWQLDESEHSELTESVYSVMAEQGATSYTEQ